MNTLRAEPRAVFAAVGIIVLLAIVAALATPAQDAPSLSVRSAAPDGALALETWINQNGYKVQELNSWTQLDDVNVLFILAPLTIYSDDDALRLENWVKQGNMLIVTGDPESINPLLHPYNLSLDYLTAGQPAALPGSPALDVPPFSSVAVDAGSHVQIEEPDKPSSAVFQVFAGVQPVVASVQVGTGWVWVSAALRPFTNKGLQDPGSARLLGNMLTSIPRTAVVAFEEMSHGFSSAGDQSVERWLLSTPPGWGILLCGIVTLVFLAMRGRRFGQSIPLPDDRVRRESAEYIHAMATLFRRSGQRREIIQHYNQQLRRALSERYGVESSLSSAELVKTVVYHDPKIDESTLRILLRQLGKSELSEQDLLRTTSELDLFLKNLT